MEHTTASPQEMKNESVRFTLHSRPFCVVECDVEALEPLVSKARRNSVKQVAKEVSLPGFRKGKAPEELIVKNYSSEIDKAWQQGIADLAVNECLRLAQVKLLRDAKITYKIKSHSLKGALLSIFCEVEPTVPHVDAKKLHKKAVKRPEVNEQKINETIRQAVLFFAKWTPITDRAVQMGDFVSLDVDIIENTPHIPLFSNTRFEVVDSSMAKWMFDLVLGKNIGDQAEGISIPDEDATEEEKRELSDKKVRITIRSIESADLPELNNDLVRQMGVNTVEEMRTNVTNLLHSQAEKHVQTEIRAQVSQFLLSDYPFDLPVTLLNKETEFRFRQLWQDTAFQEYWNSLSEEEKKKIIQTVKEQSEKAVRLFYLCRQILTDASIKITPDDLQSSGKTPLDLLLDSQQQTPHQTPEMQQAEAYSKLVLERAQDFIWNHASE